MAKLTKNGKKRKTTTGKAKPNVNMSNWRTQLQARRIKFDDDVKDIYLRELLDHGKKMIAAENAGITNRTVNDHIENDPDFAEAVDTVLDLRSQIIVNKIEQEARDGTPKILRDKDNKIVQEETKFETALRAMILKREDPAYKDKQDITLNGGAGGVLMVPAGVTLEDFVKQAEKQREIMLKDKDAIKNSED